MQDEPQAFNFDFDFELMGWHLVHLLIAFVLAFPIGWDRERSRRSLGMRTFPLVATATCGFALIGRSIFDGQAVAESRILQGLITGVGFLGGGAILKNGLSVRGTATAAAIWNTAAAGVAVAYQRYEIAIILAFLTFATMHWMKALKQIAVGQKPSSGDDLADDEWEDRDSDEPRSKADPL